MQLHLERILPLYKYGEVDIDHLINAESMMKDRL